MRLLQSKAWGRVSGLSRLQWQFLVLLVQYFRVHLKGKVSLGTTFPLNLEIFSRRSQPEPTPWHSGAQSTQNLPTVSHLKVLLTRHLPHPTLPSSSWRLRKFNAPFPGLSLCPSLLWKISFHSHPNQERAKPPPTGQFHPGKRESNPPRLWSLPLPFRKRKIVFCFFLKWLRVAGNYYRGFTLYNPRKCCSYS